jgi:hypothetical protein
MDRGVDGFRITAVPYFIEDEALRDESIAGNHTFGLAESTALLYLFREYINEWVSRNNATSKYVFQALRLLLLMYSTILLLIYYNIHIHVYIILRYIWTDVYNLIILGC